MYVEKICISAKHLLFSIYSFPKLSFYFLQNLHDQTFDHIYSHIIEPVILILHSPQVSSTLYFFTLSLGKKKRIPGHKECEMKTDSSCRLRLEQF